MAPASFSLSSTSRSCSLLKISSLSRANARSLSNVCWIRCISISARRLSSSTFRRSDWSCFIFVSSCLIFSSLLFTSWAVRVSPRSGFILENNRHQGLAFISK
ncbi:hypothetical protein BDW75DRAFT_202567 [Aspergillus navahoensis]